MLGENTEKCITFSEPIKKEQDKGKTIKYKLNFIDSFRFKSTHYPALLISSLRCFITKNVVNVSLVLSTYQSKITN